MWNVWHNVEAGPTDAEARSVGAVRAASPNAEPTGMPPAKSAAPATTAGPGTVVGAVRTAGWRIGAWSVTAA